MRRTLTLTYLWASLLVVAITALPIQTVMSSKKSMLWDYKNTVQKVTMDGMNFKEIVSVSNWNPWVPPELKGRAVFRPMIRGLEQLSGEDWAMIENSDMPIIYTFNEPDRDINHISEERAAEAWNQQIVSLRRDKGKQLVSPACASDEKGWAWLEKFMSLVTAEPPDYIGAHYYGEDGNAMIEYLEKMHRRFPKQPIIVSEWASLSRDPESVKGMTKQLCGFMKSQDWIFEHALFGAMPNVADGFVSPAAQLMNKDKEFTELGRFYMSEEC